MVVTDAFALSSCSSLTRSPTPSLISASANDSVVGSVVDSDRKSLPRSDSLED